MADYRWYDFRNDSFEFRFAALGWIAGRNDWEAGMRTFPFGGNLAQAREWVNDIRRVSGRVPRPACPRLFISHRQVDEANARRIAWLAWGRHFDYWLDVIDLDPAKNRQVHLLERKLGRPLSDIEKSVLTAAIIEMALLNCTHVLAAMTCNTSGSQWVPYEYGRVKEPRALSTASSCWWDTTTLSSISFPEYMHLGAILLNEAEISMWLQQEKALYSSCLGTPRDAEPGRSTPLPTG